MNGHRLPPVLPAPLATGLRCALVLALALAAPGLSLAQDIEVEIGAEAFALGAEADVLVPEAPSPGAQLPRADLTVAILDLATAPDLVPAPRPVTQPAWRTTFGSERQTLPQPPPDARETLMAAFSDVDAVLIQGVKSARPLRRLFPARHWRIVVARGATSAHSMPAGEVALPATAIAVRAREGLRVTGRSHSLGPTSTAPVVADIGTAPAPPERSATAIRLSDRGRSIWLASIALPQACAGEDPPCQTLQRLDGWREEKRGLGEPALIGGRVSNRTHTDEQPAACAAYAIEGDLAWERVPAGTGGISPEPGKGCIVILRVAAAE